MYVLRSSPSITAKQTLRVNTKQCHNITNLQQIETCFRIFFFRNEENREGSCNDIQLTYYYKRNSYASDKNDDINKNFFQLEKTYDHGMVEWPIA